MKKLIYFLSAVSAALLLASCNITSDDGPETVETSHTVTFRSEYAPSDTKTAVSADLLSTTWENTSFANVNVYEVTADGAAAGVVDEALSSFDSKGDESFSSALFTVGFESAAPEDPIYRCVVGSAVGENGTVATLPSAQTALASSYDPAADILVAQPVGGAASTEFEFKFKHVVAVNKITLKGLTEGQLLKSVSITADQPLAGDVSIAYAGENVSVSYQADGAKTVVVSFPEGTAIPAGGQYDVFFTSLPATVTELTLTVATENAAGVHYSYKKTATKSDGIVFNCERVATLGFSFAGVTPSSDEFVGQWIITSKRNSVYYASLPQGTDGIQTMLQEITILDGVVLFDEQEQLEACTFTIGLITEGSYAGKYYIQDSNGLYMNNGYWGEDFKGSYAFEDQGYFAWDITCAGGVWTVKTNNTTDSQRRNELRCTSSSFATFSSTLANSFSRVVLYPLSSAMVKTTP